MYDQTLEKCKSEQKRKDRKYIQIIGSNDRTHGVTEHQILFTHIDACVDTGNIFGMNSCIDTGYMGVSLVRLYNIIYKVS